MPIQSDNRIQQGTSLIDRLRRCPFVPAMDAFLYSPAYFLLIGSLSFIANALSAEIPVYITYILIGVYLSLFGRDYLPAMPIVICCYIAPSSANNPGRNETSIFFGATGIFILILAAVFVASLIFRLAADLEIGRRAFFTRKRALLSGMLLLGAAYLLAGAGSGHYFDHGYGNALFGALQFVAVFLLYYILSGAVKWEQAPSDYMAWTGMCIGFVLLAEIGHLYLTQDIIADGEILRNRIYTGWGHYNNIGALLTMMIPFAYQLACAHKHSWIFHLCGAAFLVGVFLTCSRVSILFAAITFLLCCLMLAFRSRSRRIGIVTNVLVFGGLIVFAAVFRDRLFSLLQAWIGSKLSFSDRIYGYQAGIRQFLDYPLFGGGFYPVEAELYEWSSVEAFTAFFPPRWHNTVIQLAASGGIACLAAYALHRIQTIRLIVKKPTVEVLSIGISIFALLSASLLDCHFFNIGPTLFYSMALAFAEHCLQAKTE